MDRWKGKVAVVTGASSGIGKATVKLLAEHGMIVVGLARRKAQMEENMKNFKGPGKFYPMECDITKNEDVVKSLNWVKKNFGYIDVLVNNAGVLYLKSIQDSTVEEMDHIVNVNVKGLMYCTKLFMEIFEKNQEKRESHIININSVLGHVVPINFQVNVYPATKFAVRALSDTLRNELQKTKIRVANISPGAVKTEMFDKAVEQVSEMSEFPALTSEEVADAIIYVLGLPPHIEINELMLQAKSK